MKDKDKVGFVAIFRKIQDHWIWEDPERFHAWMDILISAQFHASEKIIKGQLVKVPRGTWFISLRKLEKRWGWSRPKVLRFLSVLESEQMVNVKSTTNGTFIKVLNYEVYQSPDGMKNTTDIHTDMHTDVRTDVTADMHTDMRTDVQHTNKENKRTKGTKRTSIKDPLSAYTFSQEEIDRLDELGDEKAFPNQEIADLYWRKVLQIERGQIERPH